MKKILLMITTVFLGLLLAGFYFAGRGSFICPINFTGKEMVIRCDNRGDGFFAASRSGRRLHQGIDFRAAQGTPVLASRSGDVVAATKNKGMGKYVILRHKGNIITIYGHLSEIGVRKGQKVAQGQVIGKVGKTGNARYRDILAHLHFEVRKNGIPEDPLEYLKRDKRTGS